MPDAPDVPQRDSPLGIVVIGRNEGERLLACLETLKGTGCPVVYVDSGSKDQSVERARSACLAVLELNPSRPFSAARARNEGFFALTAALPSLQFVQFMDGDCTLQPGWLDAAMAAMNSEPCRAVVIGRVHERRPDASIYNRLCALEWNSPAGDIHNFGALGGIMMVRADVFKDLRGFDEEVIAGEDSEFGVRAGIQGFKVHKLGLPMATHDADIHRFSQWWRRAVRSGHAVGQRFSLHGQSVMHDCAKERRSVFFWAYGLPAVTVALIPITHGLSLGLVSGYLLLASRVARYRRNRGDSPSDARLYAGFVVIGKFAEGVGLLKFYLNRISGQYRIIEYK